VGDVNIEGYRVTMAAVTNAPGDSMLVVTNGLAGRTEEEAVREVVAELGGEPNVEVVTCHRESDLDGLLDRRAGRTLVVVGGDAPCTPSSSTCGGVARWPTVRSA
jgi:hypothetical protein